MFEDAPIKEAIRHEFGHLVIGREVGFTPIAVKLNSRKEACAEIDLPHSFSSPADTIDFLRRRIQTLYAGVYAQIVYGDGTIDTDVQDLLHDTARDDDSKIRELRRVIVAIEHPGLNREEFDVRSKEIDAGLRHAAEQLVKRHASSIWELGDFFYNEWKKAEEKLPFELLAWRFNHLLPKQEI